MAEERVTESYDSWKVRADKAPMPPLEPAEPKARRPYGPRKPHAAPPAAPVELSTVEAGLQGLWLVLRFVFSFFGWESDVAVLPRDEARGDAKALQPIVTRFPAIVRMLSWIGAPVVIVQRVMQHFHRRRAPEKGKPESAAVGKAPAPAA